MIGLFGNFAFDLDAVSAVLLAPTIFFGSTSLIPDFSTGCVANSVAPNALMCDRPRIIFDGMFGPEHLDLDNRAEVESFFVGWNNIESFISFDMSGQLAAHYVHKKPDTW